MRDTIGSRPYEVKKEGSVAVIALYPFPDAEYPDQEILKIRVTREDLEKLLKFVD